MTTTRELRTGRAEDVAGLPYPKYGPPTHRRETTPGLTKRRSIPEDQGQDQPADPQASSRDRRTPPGRRRPKQDRRGSCGRTPGTRAPPGAPTRRRAPGRGTSARSRPEPGHPGSPTERATSPARRARPDSRAPTRASTPQLDAVNGSPCAASASAASSTSSTVSSVSLNGGDHRPAQPARHG